MTNNLSPPTSAATLAEVAAVGGAKYQLIAEILAARLGRRVSHPDHGLTPIEIVLSMRAERITRKSGTPGRPVPFTKIAAYLTSLTGVPLRSESVRRWYRVIEPEITRKSRGVAAPDTGETDTPAIPPAVFRAPA